MATHAHAPVVHTGKKNRKKEGRERQGNDLSLEVQLGWNCSRQG